MSRMLPGRTIAQEVGSAILTCLASIIGALKVRPDARMSVAIVSMLVLPPRRFPEHVATLIVGQALMLLVSRGVVTVISQEGDHLLEDPDDDRWNIEELYLVRGPRFEEEWGKLVAEEKWPPEELVLGAGKELLQNLKAAEDRVRYEMGD